MPPLNDHDEGDIRLGVAYDPVNGVVIIDFGTPVVWLGLPPHQAIQFANIIIQNARKSQ